MTFDNAHQDLDEPDDEEPIIRSEELMPVLRAWWRTVHGEG